MKRITNIPISSVDGYFWKDTKGIFYMGTKYSSSYRIKSSEQEIAERNIKAIKYLEKKGFKSLIEKKGKRKWF